MMAKYEEDFEEERIIRVASLVEKFESEIKKQNDLKSAVKTIQMCQAFQAGVRKQGLQQRSHTHPLQRSDSESEELYFADNSEELTVITEQPRVRARVHQLNRFAQLRNKCTEIINKNVRIKKSQPPPPLLPRPKTFGSVTKCDRSSLISRTRSLQKEVELTRVRLKEEEDEDFLLVNHEDCIAPDDGDSGCETSSPVRRRATAPVRQLSMISNTSEQSEESPRHHDATGLFAESPPLDDVPPTHRDVKFRLFDLPAPADRSDSCEYAVQLRRKLGDKLEHRKSDAELERFIDRCFTITKSVHSHLDESYSDDNMDSLLQHFFIRSPSSANNPTVTSSSSAYNPTSSPVTADQSEESDQWSEGEAMDLEDSYDFYFQEMKTGDELFVWLKKEPGCNTVQSDPDLVTPDLVTPRFSDRINFPR
eukprot:sb/3465014/